VAIVTGANTGIGYETAAGLLAAGYDVVVACRDERKGCTAVERLNATSSRRGAASFGLLDLASLASVPAFVAGFRARHDALHALVLNAGMNISTDHVGARKMTADGFEICMQTNYLAHYLLMRLLLRDLVGTAAAAVLPHVPVRVVTLGSVAHRLVLSPRGADWGACFVGLVHYTYNASKLACIMMAYELQRRLAAEGVTRVAAVAANPGAVDSDIWRHLPAPLRACLRPLMRCAFLTPSQGAAPSLAAATQTEIDGRHVTGGEYVVPYAVHCGGSDLLATAWEAIGPFAGPRVVRSSTLSYDVVLWSSLWATTEAALAAHLPATGPGSLLIGLPAPAAGASKSPALAPGGGSVRRMLLSPGAALPPAPAPSRAAVAPHRAAADGGGESDPMLDATPPPRRSGRRAT